MHNYSDVALFTRAWIEIVSELFPSPAEWVALFTRAWIEIKIDSVESLIDKSRPLYEGVD